MNPWWLLVPLSYLVGTAPVALRVAARAGHDPRREGSGNPGASNVYRVAGRRAGVQVLALDMAKGLLPALAGLAADGTGLGLACGLAAMVGHVFPITRRLQGGKGVATLGGVCLALYPLLAVVLIAIWLVVMRLARTASVGSLALAVLFPIGVVVIDRPWAEVAAVIVASLLVVWRHQGNIARLVRRQERVLR